MRDTDRVTDSRAVTRTITRVTRCATTSYPSPMYKRGRSCTFPTGLVRQCTSRKTPKTRVLMAWVTHRVEDYAARRITEAIRRAERVYTEEELWGVDENPAPTYPRNS